MAELFQTLRKDALWIARSVEAWPDDGSDRSARAKLIADTLSETFHDRVPGEADWAPACFRYEDEYLDLRRRWSDISLPDRALKPIELELEAALALIFAHSEVLAYFDLNENFSFFTAIFNFDVLTSLEQDAERYEWMSDLQRQSWRELLYGPPCALAFVVGTFDILSGNSGIASSIFAGIGLLGSAMSYGEWREWQTYSKELSALEQKWGNRRPRTISARR